MHDVQRIVHAETLPATVHLLPTGGRRVGDGDRNRVVDRINEHYARGYMDEEERDAQVAAASRAASETALRNLIADLPEEKGVTARSPLTRTLAWTGQDDAHRLAVILTACIPAFGLIAGAAAMGFHTTFTQVTGVAMIVTAVAFVIAVIATAIGAN